MRIAISTWTGRLAGGVETYLSELLPELLRHGHEVAVLHEIDEPRDRPPLRMLDTLPQWCAATLGAGAALRALGAWRPDVIVAHGLEDPRLEAQVAACAPTVLFAHAYRGTCISGFKHHGVPAHSVCTRQFGRACLLHYMPRRCGGLNPITMVHLYRREALRGGLLPAYAAVVAFSDHIRAEYIRHGAPPDRCRTLPCHVSPPAASARPHGDRLPDRIVFVGRMEEPKGGHVLLEALPLVERSLGRPLHVRFVGDGRLRGRWEERARKLAPAGGGSRIDFTGWLEAAERDRVFADADLLAVPSLWPEPFGLVGLEAAGHGVPAAAFDVGGIGEWLHDGISGHLAPARPPRADGLAAAMVRCLSDPAQHARLSRGARRIAAGHSLDTHVSALLQVLEAAAGRPGAEVAR